MSASASTGATAARTLLLLRRRLALGSHGRIRRTLHTSPRPSVFHHEMLIYSSKVDGITDPTIKRSQAKLAKQERIRIKEENRKLRAALDGEHRPNLSVALPFVFGGATFLRQDAGSVKPDEVLEATATTTEGEDGRQRLEAGEGGPAAPVYPFGLFPESLTDFNRPTLASGETQDDEEDASQHAGRRRGRRGRNRGKRNEEAKKEDDVDFDVLDEGLPPKEARKLLSEDEMFRYGSSNALVPSSDVPCGGCGAHLHCKDPKMPGFTPAEMFEGKSRAALRHVLCQRCYVMRQYNVALKVSVSPEDYPRTIAHLHSKRAIVLLVVDLLDFPGSVWPDIVDLLGTNKRIILVGNKADLLPQDSEDYLSRVEKSMKEVFLEKCNRGLITHEPDLVSTILVSAKTGFNVEDLIDLVYSSWRGARFYSEGADIYLVGTTNVGKSSLFNALLESDLCKVAAVDRVEKAMTSPVPGTTLNLLRFPVMRPDPSRLNERFRRRERSEEVFELRQEEELEKLRKTRDRKYSVLRGPPVEFTFLPHRQDKLLPLTGGMFGLERTNPKTKLPARLDPSNPEFADGKWCYDTPGTVCRDQLIDLLTQEEVTKMLPDLPIKPRSFTFKAGQSLFLGGLARVDLLRGPHFSVHPTTVTVFCSDALPINLVRTCDAEEFLREALADGFLEVPSGDPVRMRDFPPLEAEEITVDGVDEKQASCEVVLSSAGWVSLTPKQGQFCRLRAWTPGGRGIYLRDPPFLPFAAGLKGRRLRGTAAYDDSKVYFPRRHRIRYRTM